MDWPINSLTLQKQWREVFHCMQSALQSESTRMLVHCVNGKDRSPLAVYAFLCMYHKHTSTTAINALSARKDRHGQPLFQLSMQRTEMLEWVEKGLSEELESESGVYTWRLGSSYEQRPGGQ